jgi:hypothetical protein
MHKHFAFMVNPVTMKDRPQNQGDQIGRFFALCANVYRGQVFSVIGDFFSTVYVHKVFY